MGLVQNDYYGAFLMKLASRKPANDESPMWKFFFFEKRVAEYFGLRNAVLEHQLPSMYTFNILRMIFPIYILQIANYFHLWSVMEFFRSRQEKLVAEVIVIICKFYWRSP